MRCPNCQQPNADDTNYCKHCGAPLGAPEQGNPKSVLKRSMTLVLIILTWEIMKSLAWLLIQKGIVPLLTGAAEIHDYRRVDLAYSITAWLFDLASIAIGVVFVVMAGYKPARALLIIYAAVHFLLLLIYRVWNLIL